MLILVSGTGTWTGEITALALHLGGVDPHVLSIPKLNRFCSCCAPSYRREPLKSSGSLISLRWMANRGRLHRGVDELITGHGVEKSVSGWVLSPGCTVSTNHPRVKLLEVRRGSVSGFVLDALAVDGVLARTIIWAMLTRAFRAALDVFTNAGCWSRVLAPDLTRVLCGHVEHVCWRSVRLRWRRVTFSRTPCAPCQHDLDLSFFV
jgi:hypothetical protein